MPRYIDADTLAQKIDAWREGIAIKHPFAEYVACLGDVLDIIEDTPTEDVVEVVQCKECKWAKWDAPNDCLACYEPHYKLVDDDFFCKYGERKKTEETQAPVAAEWISLGYRRGLFKHPFSEDYKCSACGHEVYTVMWTPPEYCPACKSYMKNGGMRFAEDLETSGGKDDE